jgi:hypothetical protein
MGTHLAQIVIPLRAIAHIIPVQLTILAPEVVLTIIPNRERRATTRGKNKMRLGGQFGYDKF